VINAFVLYPINIVGEAKATICFVIYNNNLRNRIKSIVAGFADNYTLYFENHVLISDNKASDDNDYKQLSKKTKPLEVYSENRVWLLTINYSRNLQNLSFYQFLNLLLLIFAVVILLIFAAYIAYRNYQPIKKGSFTIQLTII